MGKSISILIIFLPYIFLSSIDLNVFGLTPLIQKACDLTNIPKFCFDVLGNDPAAQLAITKFNLENIVIQLAYSNYTLIHKKVWTVTANETNPEFKKVYRACLHDYHLIKSNFREFMHYLSLGEEGDFGRIAKDAAEHLTTCMLNFINSPNIPNPFYQDNDNLLSFFLLIKIFYRDL